MGTRSDGLMRRKWLMKVMRNASEPLPISALAGHVGISGPTTYQHLRQLVDAGLVRHIHIEGYELTTRGKRTLREMEK